MVALVLVEMIKQLSSSSSSMLSLDYYFLLLLLPSFFVILLFELRFAVIFSSSITSTEASISDLLLSSISFSLLLSFDGFYFMNFALFA
jgi:hypothetical protein